MNTLAPASPAPGFNAVDLILRSHVLAAADIPAADPDEL